MTTMTDDVVIRDLRHQIGQLEVMLQTGDQSAGPQIHALYEQITQRERELDRVQLAAQVRVAQQDEQAQAEAAAQRKALEAERDVLAAAHEQHGTRVDEALRILREELEPYNTVGLRRMANAQQLGLDARLAERLRGRRLVERAVQHTLSQVLPEAFNRVARELRGDLATTLPALRALVQGLR